jgi:hypothetical protein
LFRRYEKVKKLIRARFLTAIFALVMAFAFATGIGGTAFAAPGDVVGLADFPTLSSVRPNTFDSDLVGGNFELQLVKLVEDASGDVVPQFFSSAAEADAANFTWTGNTATVDSYIDVSTGYALEFSPGLWVYDVLAYGFGTQVGPESWHADYSYNTVVTSGDFTFVTTDFIAPDSDRTANINIEFYRSDPTRPGFFIVSGDFSVVYGNDDYAPTTGAHGRSYPTALDAVAHGFVTTVRPEIILSNYAKAPGSQMLYSITDLGGTTYMGSGSGVNATSWLYAVYYSDDGIKYTRDPASFYIGPDDYKFDEGQKTAVAPALVVWGIGNLTNYFNYFPNTIYR